jgi:hypothetical protein
MKTKKPRQFRYRAVSAAGAVLTTTDRKQAEAFGRIVRVFHGRHAMPTFTLCSVSKDAAPWEVMSDAEPVTWKRDGENVAYQLTDMGLLGEAVLKTLASNGHAGFNFLMLPSPLVPKRERTFKPKEGCGGDA